MVRWPLFAAALVIVIVLLVVLVVPDWFWHPLASQVCAATYHTAAQVRDCKSYNFHSGIEGNLQELTLFTGVVVLWFKHNCYEHGCPWVGRVKGDDGHMRCKGHHKREHPDYGQPNV